MKILFTGGGTGGHFYPIIAIAEKVNEITDKEKILETKLYFMSDSPYDKKSLFENGIIYEEVNAGKLRRYFSMKNVFDLFKTFFGTIGAMFKVYSIYPDVIVSKGGYAAFPALVAARIFRIPVIIHESDSAPGKVNLWASKFAARIAVSYKEAAMYFPADKTAWTGQPIRREIKKPAKEGAYEYLKLDPTVPVIVVLGGSQGAELINNAILETLPELCSKYQIIHQVGDKNIDEIAKRASVILADHPNALRYQPYGFLNVLAMKMVAGAASLVITRAGSTIFEIASWGVPSVVIPITNSNGDHQRKNAFNYARAGACIVLEEKNLTPNILFQEIAKLMVDPEKMAAMKKAAQEFARPDAAEKIAREAVDIALGHEEK